MTFAFPGRHLLHTTLQLDYARHILATPPADWSF